MEVSGELDTLSKEHRCPLIKMLDGLQRQFRRFGEDKNLFLLLGFAPRPVQPVA